MSIFAVREYQEILSAIDLFCMRSYPLCVLFEVAVQESVTFYSLDIFAIVYC